MLLDRKSVILLSKDGALQIGLISFDSSRNANVKQFFIKSIKSIVSFYNGDDFFSVLGCWLEI